MHGRPRLIRRGAAAALLLTALAGGCARPVTVSAAPSAADVACAEVLVRLPEQSGTLTRQEVTGQSTAAWAQPGGDPANAIRLRCGIEPPGPTTDPCTVVAGVDWVVDQPGAYVRYRTYGRDPAVSVTVPGSRQDGVDAVLATVSTAVAELPVTRQCL